MAKALHADFQLVEAQERNNLQASKTWTFGEISRGDCKINAGAQFTLFADGSTSWVCDISSSDSGDEWDGSFRISNAGDVVLFDTGGYHFDISEGGVTKRWNEVRGANPNFAVAFNEAQGIRFFCDC